MTMTYDGKDIEMFGFRQTHAGSGLFCTEIHVIGEMPEQMESVITGSKELEGMPGEACDFEPTGDGRYRYCILCKKHIPLMKGE